MQFGQLAGNDYINARIYDLLGGLHPSDITAFVRKFRNDSDEQCFHTLRELILGAHLRSQGWNVRYEQKVGRKTPDWVELDRDGHVAEIIDVVTLHQRRITDRDIANRLAAEGIWTGWVTTPPDRLFSKVQEKANAYAKLIARVRVPYVVALFGEFTVPIEPQEMHHVLYELHGGVFAEVPALAGVIFFRERRGQYEYSYFPNAGALHASRIVERA
jgi:hypothetical protein